MHYIVDLDNDYDLQCNVVEHNEIVGFWIRNAKVVGSTPIIGTI